MTHTRDSILKELSEVLRTFNGREYSENIDRSTHFFGDLGMVSIDAVILGEVLEERYGRKFPFSDYLSRLAEQGAQDLEVGELVDFLHGCLSGREEC